MLVGNGSPEISIGPEVLGHWHGLPITNTMVLGTFGTVLLFIWLFFTARAIKKGSSNRNTHFLLWIFESLYDTTVEVIGDKVIAKKIIPFVVTIVFFFTINNWLELLPILNAVTYNGHSVIRGVAADLNTTLGLAIISVVTAQIWAIRRRGLLGNMRRYFNNPFKGFAHSFEGILEFIAEFSRTAALALRMFGNIFGGEVLLGVMAYLTSYGAVIALPLFYGLEIFVGAVQAYVFYMLTIVFISLGLPQSGHQEDEHAAVSSKREKSVNLISSK